MPPRTGRIYDRNRAEGLWTTNHSRDNREESICGLLRLETTMLTERRERHLTTPTRLENAIAELIVRVQGEYREMPGLKLTEVQAQRLWGLDHRTCALVLTALVE